METLLQQNFQNKRTIVFAFGFDKEQGGEQGAKQLAAHLEKKLGKDSIAMIMAEGGMGIENIGDITYAYPAVAEKGYTDLVMTLDTPGDHSSSPSSLGVIGTMAELVMAVEKNNIPPSLDSKNPFRNVLECQAKFSSGKIESWLKDALIQQAPDLGQRIADSRGDSVRSLLQTSQLVSAIQGGTHDNHLSSRVEATINYRTHPSDSIDTLLTSFANLLTPIAHNHSIAVSGFGHDDLLFPSGSLLNLTTKSPILKPSPTSPTTNNGIWDIFAGTLAYVYTNTTGPTSNGVPARLVVPVGTLMGTNTDTRYYWDLTRNIYRFSPIRKGTSEGAGGGVNERIDMRTHVEGMRVYYDLIRNLDGYEGN